MTACPTILSSPLVTLPHGSSCFLPCLPPEPRIRYMRLRVKSADARHGQPSSPESKDPLAVVLDVPRIIWRQTLRPLSDFGFGSRSIWEGGVGLFLVSGEVLLALSLAWLRGFQLRSKFRKYVAVFEFAQACGISTGTPVRIRGLTLVIRVNPSLKSIEAVFEVDDDKIIIPQNSMIEVNLSGLLMETLIDITPRDPIPSPTVGPLHPDCAKECLIACDRQQIKGIQGVSLDALVRIFTCIVHEVEEIGVNTYSLAERVSAVIEEAKPLLAKIEAMAGDNIKKYFSIYMVFSSSLQRKSSIRWAKRVHSSIMTPENTELIQKSIYTLVFTLKNIENISSDILGYTGDEVTRRNLKSLIKSLSRLL
ncbi:LOW QUALITY PROTEIN: MCE domain-containing protein [Cephalotus follicularis]|uniref:MCE domain-containing protein n=1 Tax=Cephalotus follicularis TaxID=3775 RepID=A0A1Q3D825_CEPFO|nr:LOW QUALITY PROTEIN: MCE domain-containing protein [Cephalotus follicularis]